jgi:signal transduction histidine kinase
VHPLRELAGTSTPDLAVAAPNSVAATSYSERARADRDTAAAILAVATASKDRLVAIFGHELRSHLAPIKNASELLQRSTLDPATARQVAAIIERQVDGMTRLVDELLASAQSEALQPILRRVETVVEIIVKRSVEMVEPLASARRQTLLIRIPTEPIQIAADETWVAQALQNVIGNAVKYTDPGGHIEVEVKHDAPAVVLSVRDTGIGLAPAQLETIFDLYTRAAQPAARPSAGGLGIGLHLAKFVVEAHGGSIRATSEGLGRGSTFVIRLPCRAPGRPSR